MGVQQLKGPSAHSVGPWHPRHLFSIRCNEIVKLQIEQFLSIVKVRPSEGEKRFLNFYPRRACFYATRACFYATRACFYPHKGLLLPPQGLASTPQGLASTPQGLTSTTQGLASTPQGLCQRLSLKLFYLFALQYLDDYNMNSSKEMKLVFFMDAIEHVSRWVY